MTVCRAAKTIMNIDTIQERYDIARNNNIRVVVPSIEEDVTTTVDSFEDLKNLILDLTVQLPHHRLAIQYSESDGVINIEVHPVTGAA